MYLKVFCGVGGDGLSYVEDQVNEWLESEPVEVVSSQTALCALDDRGGLSQCLVVTIFYNGPGSPAFLAESRSQEPFA